ncbi:MAG TPA: OpgC domain-containing protein [Edaphobacter sp.]|nr:OpgC domain-containing protein [Edaphobacter sp.]
MIFHIITGRSVRSALRDLSDASLRDWASLKSSAQQNMESLNLKEPLPVDRKSRLSSVLGFGRVQRRPEIDALRGVFLVWMTLTHLPTHLSDLVNEPFGFVSSAEGFVFLSALLVARLYIRQAAEAGAALRTKLWKRALLIYGYHLILLTFAFTMAATFAVMAHRLALINLLNFYLAHPFPAIVGSLLLIYCPPLLDILPMYVIFLLITPFLLAIAVHRGWKGILLASGSVWLLAQFGLRAWVHDVVVHVTTLQIPLQDTGSFNLFAWQMVWISGLCIGATSAREGRSFRRPPRFVYQVSALVCSFFIGVRHNWFGNHLTQQTLGMQLDKWQLGPLRLVNLVAFAFVIYWSRKLLTRLFLIEPFIMLGKASLQVFCAHLAFVFVGLALLYGTVSQLHGFYAFGLVASTFVGLIFVALLKIRREGQDQTTNNPELKINAPPTYV